jgi:hypothetical protein
VGCVAEREEADEQAFDQWEEEERVVVAEEEEETQPGGVPDAVAPDELAVTAKAPAAKKAFAKGVFSLSFSRKGRANASVSK